MPKDRRSKLSRKHQPSAKTASRIFAVSEDQTERVDQDKDLSELPANELLRATVVQSANPPKAPIHVPTKKEKQQAKHEQLIQRLAADTSPYSRSHNRRLKRKQKSMLSTDLQSVQKALDTIAEDLIPAAETRSGIADHTPLRSKQTPGMIGEGKGVTLTKRQRKRALELERLRQSTIMTNTDYRQNPFDAIRRHAQSSLLSHENGKS
ncbi:hypothetical protein RSOLAG1IB_01393 [Rhizoctonia solani AG-1 IB]|uniref:Ribosome biogenesis protein SLX9 n=1 Tax=Thanatephorus cucumeris (strain AG1-IB / isolate 7/3/14) TaxID=1108050 RepID=A0A0B7FGQ2_THACB|nr:hypothetical protein RSOLAG1IB_01393 [Rhizoctonia solani AG-1 IB]